MRALAICLLGFIPCIGHSVGIKLEDISFSTTVDAAALSVNERNVGARSQDGTLKAAKVTVMGAERRDCVSKEATRSHSSAHAHAELLRRDAGLVGIALNVGSQATGGQEELCTQCQGNFCVIPAGEKPTSAESKSNATATIVYRLEDKLRGAGTYRFTLIVDESATEKANQRVMLRRKGVQGLGFQALELKDGIPTDIDARPGEEVTISISLDTSARSDEPTKKALGQGELKVRVRVTQAPILEAAVNHGYIFKGTKSTDDEFKAVGLLATQTSAGLAPHCTATIVGASTILTAAHCIAQSSIQEHLKRQTLFFVVGNDYRAGTPVQVESAAFPQGEPPEKFRFNEKFDLTLEDDVAVLYTTNPIGVSGVALYDGDPKIEDIWRTTKVTIVGYGFDPSDPDDRGNGVQRQAAIPLVDVDNRTFRYSAKVGGASTCRGDSGGPAFLRTDNNKYRLIGITSYGALNCSGGRSMRTDTYLPWIKRHIKN